MKFADYLNEAKTGRAWDGKLKKIEKLVIWLENKGILNKGEMKEREILFRRYYRYYNDGDLPRGMKMYTKDQIALMLEEELEAFLKKILSKYSPKIDRQEFKLANMIDDLSTVKRVASRHDAYALVNYWHKNVKDEEILNKIRKLEVLHIDLKDDINEIIESIDFEKEYGLSSWKSPRNKIIPAQIEIFKSIGYQLPKRLLNQWDKMVKEMDDIASDIGVVIQALQTLKDERLINKK